MKELGINLLKTQQALSPYELTGLARTKAMSLASLVLLLIVGVIVGAAMILVNMRVSNIITEKQNVSRKLTLSSRKEVLLLSLKERLPVTEKTLQSQYPWSSILTAIKGIASPPLLSGFRIDENNVFMMDLTATSFEEINTVVERVIQLVVEKSIKQPSINSLSIDNEGIIKASIQFTPTF